MKPKEFDDLIRQKFDQNDFAYNPRNWDRLAKQMDGPAKKRSMLMWWLMPLAGVAASVALAMGVSPVLRQMAPAGANTEVAKTHAAKSNTQSTVAVTVPAMTDMHHILTPAANSRHMQAASPIVAQSSGENVTINLMNAIPNTTKKHTVNIDLRQMDKNAVANEVKKTIDEPELMSTFTPEEEQRAPKTSVILNGGYNAGSVNTGYALGATIRKMVSDKMYIESDLGFASSTNVQTNSHTNQYIVYSNGTTSSVNAGRTTSGGIIGTATPATGSAPRTTADNNPVPVGVGQDEQNMNISYSMNYVQLSPAIGCKITKKFSLAAGPDMQQALADKRPATDPTAQIQQTQVPLFDMGLMGKSEYAVTKKIKAGIYYRKGINNLFTPDKYTERDYMQFQLKYILFNK